MASRTRDSAGQPSGALHATVTPEATGTSARAGALKPAIELAASTPHRCARRPKGRGRWSICPGGVNRLVSPGWGRAPRGARGLARCD